MTDLSPTVSLLQALVLGIAGAGLAMLLNLPAGVLVGPALAVAAVTVLAALLILPMAT